MTKTIADGQATMPTPAEMAIDATSKLRQAADSLHAQLVTMEAEKKSLQQRNATLYALPLNSADAKKVIMDCVKARARLFESKAKYHSVFQALKYPNARRQGGGDQERGDPLALRHVANPAGADHAFGEAITMLFRGDLNPLDAAQADVLFGRMCFFFGELLNERIEALFTRFWPEEKAEADRATTIATRREEIAANDSRLAVLVPKIDAINTQLYDINAALRKL